MSVDKGVNYYNNGRAISSWEFELQLKVYINEGLLDPSYIDAFKNREPYGTVVGDRIIVGHTFKLITTTSPDGSDVVKFESSAIYRTVHGNRSSSKTAVDSDVKNAQFAGESINLF